MRFAVVENKSGGFVVIDTERASAVAYYSPDRERADVQCFALNAYPGKLPLEPTK